MNYEIEVFDSRNTSTPQVANGLYVPTSWEDLKVHARKLSLTNPFPVVARKGGYPKSSFVVYEKGAVTEWSDGQEEHPIPGKQYALTGAPGAKSIANGNSWGESRVQDPTRCLCGRPAMLSGKTAYGRTCETCASS